MNLAASQVPDEPAVDRAETQRAGRGTRPTIVDLVEQPPKLARREQRIDREPGLTFDGREQPALPELSAERCCPPALPDDARAERAAGGSIPDERGLALVGQRDGN